MAIGRSIGLGIVARPACAQGIFAIVSSILLSACSAGSAQTPPSTAAQSQGGVVILEPGKQIDLKISGSEKRLYNFELSQGQYTTISVNCPNLGAMLYLLNSSGNAIDRIYGVTPTTKEEFELAADQSGRYGLEIEPKLVNGGDRCTVQVASARSASEKDFLLQQARTGVFEAAGLVNAGKAKEASDQLQKVLKLREKLLGPDDPSVVRPLALLGNLSMGNADYKTAEALYTRALTVQDRADPQSGQVFSILNNLGIIYASTDRFKLAEQTLLRAIDVGEKVYGVGRPAAVNTMVNLGGMYQQEGDYPKAQALYERALAAGEKALGLDYPGLAVIISYLADVYSERGDYVQAIRLGQRAVALREKSGGPEDRRLAVALAGLADAYRFHGDLDQAEPLYEHSLKICEKVLAAEDPLIADTLSSLGDIHRSHHEFAKAEDFYRRSLAIRQKTLGAENSSVGESFASLGSLYRDQGDYARSETLYRQALVISEKALGPEHPDVAETLTNLFDVEMAERHKAEAESLLSRAINISERNAELNLVAGSERQKLAYLKLSSAQLDRAITLNANVAPEQEAALHLAITTVLQRKGRVQDTLADNLKALRQGLDPDGVRLLDEFDEVTSQLARLVLSGPKKTTIEEHNKKVTVLQEKREQLEAQISLRSAQFRAASQPVTLEAVRAAIPADGALIEFVNYQRLLPGAIIDKNQSGESRYIAYILRRSGQVQWKELGDAEELDRAVDAYRQALRDPNRKDVKGLARRLDEKILQPLRPLLGDAGHLLISPDGQLSLIPFEALADPHGQYAIQRYLISYLGTGRDLLRMQVGRESQTGPVVIADPAFDEPGTSLLARADLRNPRVAGRSGRRSITTGKDLSDVYFAPLSGTAQEARAIELLFPESRVLTGAGASKPALKQLNAPRILHIATHGFFLQDANAQEKAGTRKAPADANRTIQASASIENPLLRSGLALSGANVNKSSTENGILTALEAANLNLWGTKLVTLSACDTGVGEVKDREGVYGLRRAFVLAGAESLVMSLWPVSDYVTREMMTAYYTGLKRGLGRGEALRLAELAMLKRKGHEHPFYWASFIQSGEWANLRGKR